jgi:hypothetical protein
MDVGRGQIISFILPINLNYTSLGQVRFITQNYVEKKLKVFSVRTDVFDKEVEQQMSTYSLSMAMP